MSNAIEQKLQELNWDNYNEVIKFYEDNKTYYDEFQNYSDHKTLISIINVKLTYCFALIKKYHYSKCLDIFSHLKKMISKLDKDTEPEYENIYERFLFAEGVVLSKLKRYAHSQQRFKELVTIDPENDWYNDWYDANKIRLIYKKFSFIGWIAFAVVMINWILWDFFDIEMGNHISIISALIMILSFSIPFILRWIYKIRR